MTCRAGLVIAGVSLAALGLGLLYETAQQAPWPVTTRFSGLYAGGMVLLLGVWLDS